MNDEKLGATGKFPKGHLDESDEGELRFAVTFDPSARIVRIEFGKPVAWLGLYPPEAIEFARLILKHAGAKKIEITL
jgi:hypothetical protein